MHELVFDQTVPSQKELWDNLSCCLHDYMISCKKSVTRNDWIKYFKKIVEVSMKFSFKHRKQIIVEAKGSYQLQEKKKHSEKKRYLYCVKVEVSRS